MHKRVGLLSNPYKDPRFETVKRAEALLKSWGVEGVLLLPDTVAFDRTLPLKAGSSAGSNQIDRWDADCRTALADCDLLISFGGDGTFLQAVHLGYPLNIPVAGVNLGSLGFLAEVRLPALEDGLERLISGRYRVEERTVLSIVVADRQGQKLEELFALNETVLSRGSAQRLLPIELWLDGCFTEVIPSDGLMVSTPTGSTGYSMAAGGPIVQPNLDLMLITPICPHTLHNRSYVIAPETSVELKMRYYPYEPVVSIDGRHELLLEATDTVLISRNREPLRVPKIYRTPFFRDLPEKIHGRGFIKNTEVDQHDV